MARDLQNKLEAKISIVEDKLDADIKVGVYDLLTKEKAYIKGDQTGWAASVIKVPIMLAVAKEITKGNLDTMTELEVNHDFKLEEYDYVSRLPNGSKIKVFELLYHMITSSDNEATNILANEIGVPETNKAFWRLGLRKTMLGHLLCPGVPRYKSSFNPDGSNITCPKDMVKTMRHIYDNKFSKLTQYEKELSKIIMSRTYPTFLNAERFRGKKIRSKVGCISDPVAGSDSHEVGIIDDRLIVSLMANKIGQNRPKDVLNLDLPVRAYLKDGNFYYCYPRKDFYSVGKAYSEILDIIGDHFYGVRHTNINSSK